MNADSTAGSATCARRNRRKILLFAAGVLCGILLCFAWFLSGRGRHAPARDPRVAVKSAPEDADQRLRRQIVGTWHDDYQGSRTMSLRDDGTGTMVVELSGWKATLFAARLQFEMTWSVAQGRLKKRTTGGEPAAQVEMILKTMGDHVEEPILELTEQRLLLLDQDGTTKYDWQRAR